MDMQTLALATKLGGGGGPGGGDKNVIETVKVNGEALTIENKAVDVKVPTTVAQMEDAADYAKQAEVDKKVDAAYGVQYAGYALVVGSDGNVGAGDLITTTKIAVTTEGEEGHITFSFIEKE